MSTSRETPCRTFKILKDFEAQPLIKYTILQNAGFHNGPTAQ